MDFDKRKRLAEIKLERDLRELAIKNRKQNSARKTHIKDSLKSTEYQRSI